MRDYKELRQRMVKYQLESRGIRSRRVLDAMLKVERHLFVPSEYRAMAYDDHPLPIGEGQTISQPYIVAYMTEILDIEPDDRVLEIGTGSGYQTAILAELAGEVFTVERIPSLAYAAKDLLEELGYTNIRFRLGDGSLGWEEWAPYDKIIVTAASKTIPQPLVEQLKLGGKMAIPLGGIDQTLYIIVKDEKGIKKYPHFPVAFVPLITDEERNKT